MPPIPGLCKIVDALRRLGIAARYGVPPTPHVNRWFIRKEQHIRACVNHVIPRLRHGHGEVDPEIFPHAPVIDMNGDGRSFGGEHRLNLHAIPHQSFAPWRTQNNVGAVENGWITQTSARCGCSTTP